MSTVIERKLSFRIPLNEEEQAMLHAVAQDAGTSAADVLRQYIRKAYAKKIGGRAALDKKARAR